MLLLYLQFRVKYIMCQILPHTTNLIFTKEVGLIATLPSRGEKTEAPDPGSHNY